MFLLNQSLFQHINFVYQHHCSDIFARYFTGPNAGTQSGNTLLKKKRNSFGLVPGMIFEPALSKLQVTVFLTALFSVG